MPRRPSKKTLIKRYGATSEEVLRAYPPVNDSGLKTLRKGGNSNKNPVRFGHLTKEQRHAAQQELDRLMNRHRARLAKDGQWLVGLLVARATNYAQYGGTRWRCIMPKRFKQKKYLALIARDEGLDVEIPVWPSTAAMKRRKELEGQRQRFLSVE